MILYVPAAAGERLSVALWALARPVFATGGTDRMFGVVTALDASVWLVVETTFEIVVHPEAVLGEIGGILQPWIDDLSLPADTLTTLSALVDDSRGQVLVVYDAFPPFFKGLAKDWQGMIDAGLLAAPEGGM